MVRRKLNLLVGMRMVRNGVEENYKDGKKEGKIYLVGIRMVRMESEGNYKDHKFEGKMTWWYQNGQIKSEGNYKDGECISGDC